MPHLQSLYSANSDDVLVLGISTDPGDSVSQIQNHARNRGITFPMAPNDRSIVVNSYRVSSQSSAVGIDASGVIRLRKGYGLQGASDWREWFEELAGS